MGKHDFDTLADNAERMLAEDRDIAWIEPHWSDDPRYQSRDHYDRVQAGLESLSAKPATADDLRKDAEFRDMRVNTGNGLYEPVSWSNIWRDGRHGRGHEGL